ncbi:MAG: tRNA (N6-isopentenyl adenosine(37)-C2)-methylthiotransferase MiaB [Termitinemataceae bacterium]|nr:MAG: tRNA (N6-isopentenyl adenosine(37)-C2)-methylthiotransferase MiaB [Termitinemataceae bacterium]
MTFFFETYGCQMNLAESAALKNTLLNSHWSEQALTSLTHSNDPSFENIALIPDLIIINTCSVRITAEQRVLGRLQFYSALKKTVLTHGKKIFVLVTGCMADRLGSALIEKGADYILSTQKKQLFPSILCEIEEIDKIDEINQIDKTAPDKFIFAPSYFTSCGNDVKFRAFVPIMHGCNNFCSYCIVPYVRGPEVSRPPNEILSEIKFLSDNGIKEITLLGQNVNSYLWEDIDFAILLEMIAEYIEKHSGSIEWVRFLSSHPKDLTIKTIKIMSANKIFAKHLHLCVQHGSNKILQAMNRGYNRQEYLNLVWQIRDAMPQISLSTDILVGFPGETEDDFKEVLSLMESVRFLYSYMYHYNPREGTASFEMSGRIDEKIKIERLKRVINLQQEHTQHALNLRINCTEKVLVENISRNNKNQLVCRSERDESVIAEGSADLIGTFKNVKIQSAKGNTLRGTFLCN